MIRPTPNASKRVASSCRASCRCLNLRKYPSSSWAIKSTREGQFLRTSSDRRWEWSPATNGIREPALSRSSCAVLPGRRAMPKDLNGLVPSSNDLFEFLTFLFLPFFTLLSISEGGRPNEENCGRDQKQHSIFFIFIWIITTRRLRSRGGVWIRDRKGRDSTAKQMHTRRGRPSNRCSR